MTGQTTRSYQSLDEEEQFLDEVEREQQQEHERGHGQYCRDDIHPPAAHAAHSSNSDSPPSYHPNTGARRRQRRRALLLAVGVGSVLLVLLLSMGHQQAGSGSALDVARWIPSSLASSSSVVALKDPQHVPIRDVRQEMFTRHVNVQPTTDATLDDLPLYNMTLCGIVTAEDNFLSEWLTYHRTLGVQRFHLYDYEDSSSTAARVLPFVEAGLVDFHTIRYRDGRPSTQFQYQLLDHCTKTYGNLSEWLLHIDVDEYLQLSPMYGYEGQPYRLEPGGPIQYPLHEVLRTEALRWARCIPLTRGGDHKNVGVLRLGDHDSLLDSSYYRFAQSPSGYGKVMVRGGKHGVLARIESPHFCTLDGVEDHVDGILDFNEHPFRSAQGQIQDNGGDPGIFEPLSIQHFEQRSLENCVDKLKIINRKENWRLKAGGAKQCYEQFIPTPDQLSSGVFAGHEYEKEAVRGPTAFVVEDNSLRTSWYGRTAIEMMRQLRAGNTLPVPDPEGLKARTVRILVDEKDDWKVEP